MKTALFATLATFAMALDAAHAREMVAGSISGTVSAYTIATPDIGSCRLQGIATSSDNFKNYASVSGKDSTLNDGCARCIKVTRDDDATKSVTAYVLDVSQGAAAGSLKLSQTALGALAVDVNSNNVTVSYKFVNCPSAYASGNVKACLMEGASNAYIPLQFYNAQKVIASVKINGVDATSTKDSFLFSATSGQSKESASSWFSSIAVEMTSYDNETLAGTFEFGAASGCATYTTQFSSASTADGTDSSSNKSSSDNGGVLLPVLLSGAGALLLVIGSVFFVRRRRVARAGIQTPNGNNNDVENQYLTPKPKSSPAGPTYASDHSNSGKHDPEPRSPTIDYEQSFSPAASFGGAVAASSVPVAAPTESHNHDHDLDHSVSSGSGSNYSYTKPPTYSFSSNVSTSPHRPKAQTTVPTFQAPVVPTYSAPMRQAPPTYEHPSSRSFSDDNDSDDSDEHASRSSFDIDDMRNTEEMKSVERGDSRYSAFGTAGRSTQQYAAPPDYASASVTSPQSYVRATSLRRNTSSGRTPSAVYRSNNSAASAEPYDAGAAYMGPGSLRESSGYSRDSLSILGYPYAKKNTRNGSGVTGT